jgi:hypothetical protein
MAFELGLHGTKNLGPYLKSLEAKHLISTRTAMGRKFYLVHDPRVGLQHLLESGRLSQEEIEEINQLCLDLGQAPFHLDPAQAEVAVPTVPLKTQRRIQLAEVDLEQPDSTNYFRSTNILRGATFLDDVLPSDLIT